MNYIEPLLPEVEKIKVGNKVKYTIHFHRPVFSEELLELYKKYHLAIYQKEKNKSDLQRHLCNSPVYDPELEAEVGTRPCPKSYEGSDDMRQYTLKDEGIDI